MSIKLHDLSVGYNNNSILENITLEIPQGKIIALLGVNGCGKSTLLKSIAKIQQSLKGKVEIDGKDVEAFTHKQLAHKISYLPQHSEKIEGITVYDYVAFGRTPYLGFLGRLKKADHDKIKQAIELTKISHLQNKMLNELSGGQLQLACLAMTIAQDTDYILLDEPTTYLDLSHQLELMEIIKNLQTLNKTVIMVLHDINQAFRYCDYLFIFGNKRLLNHGEPAQIINAKMLEDNFNLKGLISNCPVSSKPCFFAY
ncbi:ABC transporter ATP-binding protein [Psittacicella hinzii]|uniref:ABC transporter domain-containing protein n=1 Tax=Psittacicella hinzii TaxID=2028575 RepID=A0A3A1YIZ4_9GAMM|nr:ATP-binding cassette domain-containing protein [Psittacicella hinzii]RIY36214.1 hypothetical protein CKF58_06125 [Psittacicella hinzii]